MVGCQWGGEDIKTGLVWSWLASPSWSHKRPQNSGMVLLAPCVLPEHWPLADQWLTTPPRPGLSTGDFFVFLIFDWVSSLPHNFNPSWPLSQLSKTPRCPLLSLFSGRADPCLPPSSSPSAWLAGGLPGPCSCPRRTHLPPNHWPTSSGIPGQHEGGGGGVI